MGDTKKPIRTAVLGTGFMGRVHLEALRRVEFVEAVAIAGRNAEAARRLGAGFSIPTIATDYRDVLRDPAIDAVHICTPNAQHFPMAKDALQAGKHVICEKPLATSVAEGEELVALAVRQRVRNCVCHNLRFYPMVQQMRRMCEAGDLGELLVVQGTYFQDWLLHDTDWNWRVDAGRMGARTRGSVTVSQVSAGRKNRFSIEIYGTRSSVAWNQERPDELWVGRRDTGNEIMIKDPSLLDPAARSYADLPGGHSEGYDDTFKQLFRRFYAFISSPGSAPEYPQFVDGLRQLTILDAALQSHRTRRWVDVPTLETGI